MSALALFAEIKTAFTDRKKHRSFILFICDPLKYKMGSPVLCLKMVSPLFTGNPKTGILADSEDPDEMPHNAAFHQCLHWHCLLRLKQPSRTEKKHRSFILFICDPLKYKMGSPVLNVLLCMKYAQG